MVSGSKYYIETWYRNTPAAWKGRNDLIIGIKKWGLMVIDCWRYLKKRDTPSHAKS